jgi:hypothetical protein
MQCRQCNKSCIDLEVVSQIGPRVTASKSIGPQCDQSPGEPFGDCTGQCLEIIRCGDEDTCFIFKALLDITILGCFGRMQEIPSVRFKGIGLEFFIAGYTPNIGRDIVFGFQHLLRLDHFGQDGTAAEKIGFGPVILIV